jgi:23S rRNA-/tRNA-specific pseudouridylate synthase
MSVEKQKITLTCEVDSYRSGWTIVRFLAHRFKYHTPERWTERVIDGWVLLNGSHVAPDHAVKKGDVVTYTIFHAEPEVDFRYDVIYEDDYLLAISKSGNIPVHACGVYIRNTLIGTLKNIYGDTLNLAHRLDRETSGLTLLTKDPQTARVMGKMFAEGHVWKLYSAVVHGRIRRESFEVDAPIGKTLEEITPRPEELPGSDLAEDLPRYVPRRRVDRDKGKPAVTRFEVEKFLGGCTLVRAMPLSGRTNQIRVHLDHVGHPIVGDKVYKLRGPRVDDEPGTLATPGMATELGLASETGMAAGLINRHALHCRELRFTHPADHRLLHLTAPYPEDFVRLVESLEARGDPLT